MTEAHATRPWGSYLVLAEDADHKVKRIAVRPGKRPSYQVHEHRAEHWFVVRGEGTATVDGRAVRLSSGDSVDIPVGAAHRIENTGVEDLVFIEVQHGGSYFGEDDIVRLDDDFGRSGGG